jgi:hypothetical protein
VVPWVVVALVAAVASCGDADGAGGGDGRPSEGLVRLERDAMLVGVALDAGEFAHIPRRWKPELLERTGVVLDDATRVTDYLGGYVGAGPAPENPDDFFQFCVTNPDGAWVTYGDTTGRQASGESGARCEFTGEPDPDADRELDLRLTAQDLREKVVETWTEDDYLPSSFDAEVQDRLGIHLPAGYTVSKFDPDSELFRFCATAPDGEWFLVNAGLARVRGYGTDGECLLAEWGPGARWRGPDAPPR